MILSWNHVPRGRIVVKTGAVIGRYIWTREASWYTCRGGQLAHESGPVLPAATLDELAADIQRFNLSTSGPVMPRWYRALESRQEVAC